MIKKLYIEVEYKIHFEDIANVQRELSNSIAIWNNSINNLLKAIKNFSDDSSLKGETMDSIKVYLCEVHGTLLVSMQNLLQNYAYSFLLYKDGYYNIDSDSKAKLSEQIFVNLRKELSDSRNNFANQIDLLISTKNKVSDLISYSGNSHDTTISNYNFLISGLDTLNNRIIAYEKLHQLQDLKLFKELLVSTRNFMENYSNKARDISTYQSGDLAKIDFAKELAVALDNSNRYLSNRKNIIEEADKRDKVRWEQIFAKERRNKGIKKLIVRGLTLLVGTAAIVATGGSATPLVVLAGKICGTGTVAYSVSNMTEAGQDVIYGSLGDNKTGAINPIRDTVFLGNDKLYHGTGQFFTIGSSILIPIGKTNSIIKGSCQFLAGSAGAWVGGKVGYYGLKQLGFSEENARIGQFIASMLGAYAGSKIASGFTLNKTFKLDESFLKLNTKVEKIIVSEETWNKLPTSRGIIIDRMEGNNNLGHNFPVIDRLENRVITSIKSRDLSAESYLTGKRLEYTIKSDINKLIDFERGSKNNIDVTPEDYSFKCLEVVVPNVTLNESQINCINNAIEYGKLNNIIVKITVGGN